MKKENSCFSSPNCLQITTTSCGCIRIGSEQCYELFCKRQKIRLMNVHNFDNAYPIHNICHTTFKEGVC